MTIWTTRTIGDGEDTIVLLPDELVAELGWPTGTDVRMRKIGDVIYVRKAGMRNRRRRSAD